VLRVAQIGFLTDPRGRVPEELLRDWPTLVDVAEATSTGAAAYVLQASPHRHVLERRGVAYYFLPFGHGSGSRDYSALDALLHELSPHVLHVNGLHFAHDVLRLTALRPHTPVLLQDHANAVPWFWRRPVWRRAFAAASAVAFCSREQAMPFQQKRIISGRTPIYEIPESTSRFGPGDQSEARRLTGLYGDPIVLWVGHLNSNKDPLAVLEGVGSAARDLPALQLWCCFASAPLLAVVKRRIDDDPLLRGRVHLLGRVSHERVELLMRAADVFVSGSHREGSGYSLIEALACGLTPVVTDIPSFRSLTGHGSVGILWRPGDGAALQRALVSVARAPQPTARIAVRAHFDRELSAAALGRKLLAVYLDMLSRVARRPELAGDASVSHSPSLVP
jgi:glycosyltransferase involved in cell wall biosynthesis